MPARSLMWSNSRTTITTNPPTDPPSVDCPDCERLLRYIRSYVSGTRARVEQWDLFDCLECRASYEYRHRTGRLRRAPESTPLK